MASPSSSSSFSSSSPSFSTERCLFPRTGWYFHTLGWFVTPSIPIYGAASGARQRKEIERWNIRLDKWEPDEKAVCFRWLFYSAWRLPSSHHLLPRCVRSSSSPTSSFGGIICCTSTNADTNPTARCFTPARSWSCGRWSSRRRSSPPCCFQRARTRPRCSFTSRFRTTFTRRGKKRSLDSVTRVRGRSRSAKPSKRRRRISAATSTPTRL